MHLVRLYKKLKITMSASVGSLVSGSGWAYALYVQTNGEEVGRSVYRKQIINSHNCLTLFYNITQ